MLDLDGRSAGTEMYRVRARLKVKNNSGSTLPQMSKDEATFVTAVRELDNSVEGWGLQPGVNFSPTGSFVPHSIILPFTFRGDKLERFACSRVRG